jgi:hypothetical protein
MHFKSLAMTKEDFLAGRPFNTPYSAKQCGSLRYYPPGAFKEFIPFPIVISEANDAAGNPMNIALVTFISDQSFVIGYKFFGVTHTLHAEFSECTLKPAP